uniref:Dematin actin binding protein n=1 Tax=Varanus komodoensis TaxID=61221 RepID=A0A8D2JC22_VARKO
STSRTSPTPSWTTWRGPAAESAHSPPSLCLLLLRQKSAGTGWRASLPEAPPRQPVAGPAAPAAVGSTTSTVPVLPPSSLPTAPRVTSPSPPASHSPLVGRAGGSASEALRALGYLLASPGTRECSCWRAAAPLPSATQGPGQEGLAPRGGRNGAGGGGGASVGTERLSRGPSGSPQGGPAGPELCSSPDTNATETNLYKKPPIYKQRESLAAPAPQSKHLIEDQIIESSKFPAAQPPEPGQPAKIETDYWPCPPSLAVVETEWRRRKASRRGEPEEEEELAEDVKRLRELQKEELSKVASNLGKLILKEEMEKSLPLRRKTRSLPDRTPFHTCE